MDSISANGSVARRDPEFPPPKPASPTPNTALAGKSAVVPSPAGERAGSDSALDASLGMELNAAVQGLVARAQSKSAPVAYAGPTLKVVGSLHNPKVKVDPHTGVPDAVTRTHVQVAFDPQPQVADPKRVSTDVNLELDVRPGQTSISYRRGVDRTDSDAYVPSRSLEQHEQAHFAVAAEFWKKEHLQEVLRQIALPAKLTLPGAVPFAKARAAGREYDAAIAQYLASYVNYLQDRALHREAMAAHDPHYPAQLEPPKFVDPHDLSVKTPKPSDLDTFYTKIISGIPNISPEPTP